jgi:hypothetical protein
MPTGFALPEKGLRPAALPASVATRWKRECLPDSAVFTFPFCAGALKIPTTMRMSTAHATAISSAVSALDGTISCASGSYFFVFDMSFFVLKMKTHVSY